MKLRGLSQSALARELGISSGVMSQWFHGAMPELRSALKVAQLTGLPERQVLEAAGLTVQAAATQNSYPAFATEFLDQLDPAEWAVIAETARGLLRLREERLTAAAPSPPRARQRRAPA